jgi:hypothetical protein
MTRLPVDCDDGHHINEDVRCATRIFLVIPGREAAGRNEPGILRRVPAGDVRDREIPGSCRRCAAHAPE